MKAFPLIYSRTKNEDFVPDFLARPHDLDVGEALKYVHNAMEGLDTLNTIRYTAFSVGNYCICGGIAGISKVLLERVKSMLPSASMENVSNYLTDCKGRSLACFVGFAIPKSGKYGAMIPNIPLAQYWETYLAYLKHQWLNYNTSSEKLALPEITLKEKLYSSSFCPKIEQIDGHGAIRNFEQNEQSILDYYFDQLLNHDNTDASFISHVLYKFEWKELYFANAAISDELYQALKSSASVPISDMQNTPMSQFKQAQKQKTATTGIGRAQSLIKSTALDEVHEENLKKNKSILPVLLVAGLVILLIILLFVL